MEDRQYLITETVIKMNKSINLFIIISTLLLISCKSKNTIKVKADLTFKSISFLSAYGASEQQLKSLNKQIDSLNADKKNLTEETKLLVYFEKLRNLDLLNNPYIFIQYNKDSIIPVYLSNAEFEKVKDFRYAVLFNENKKIELELHLEKKEENIYYSENITSVKKVDKE